MKVLWVTNQPVAHLRKMLNLPICQSGGWMETSYESLKKLKDLTLCIATIYDGLEMQQEIEDGNVFIAVPSKQPIGNYNPNDSYNLRKWSEVLNEFKPEIIQVWGTEYALALCVLKVCKGKIPSVVYIQGMLNQLANHYNEGVAFRNQLLHITLRDLINRNFFWNRKKQL